MIVLLLHNKVKQSKRQVKQLNDLYYETITDFR